MSPALLTATTALALSLGLGKIADARLDMVLREWQKADRAVRDRHFAFKRTDNKVTFGEKSTVSCEILAHKPNLLLLDQTDKGGKSAWMCFCNGKTIHAYDSGTKTECVWELPDSFGFPEKPEQYPSGFFNEMAGGMLEHAARICLEWPVKDLKDRFAVTLLQEDKYWIYIGLKPRQRRDSRTFEHTRIVLNAQTFRVRQIWQRHGNGDEQTWDFGDADIDQKPVTIDAISKGLPTDWERITVPLGKSEKKLDKQK